MLYNTHIYLYLTLYYTVHKNTLQLSKHMSQPLLASRQIVHKYYDRKHSFSNYDFSK